MTRLVMLSLLAFFYNEYASGQSLVLKGRVRCYNQHERSSKGAENVVIVPTFVPGKSTITASAPAGYFEINTNVPFETLRDKQVHLYIVSRCGQCRQVARRVFISEDQDKRSTDPKKAYVTVRDWKLDGNCTDAELTAFKADSVLAVVMKQPAVSVKDISSATAVVGAPPLLNLLSTVAGVPAVVAQGQFFAQRLEAGNIEYGNFMLASPLYFSSNTGFNFSPSRNLSEAMFWNPSAIAKSRELHNISLFTNARNNLKFGGYLGLTEKISLGAGLLYTKQSESRLVIYNTDRRNPDPSGEREEQHIMKLDEYAIFLSPVLKINNRLSLAVTGKLVNQRFNAPDSLDRPDGNREGVFFDSTISRKVFDGDFSLSYNVSNAFQVGLNVMNLSGSTLYADAFVAGQVNRSYVNQRSAGLGLTYKWRRFNFGSDLIFTEDGFYDASFGVNFIPFNNALISAGVAVKQTSYSVSLLLKNFRITYIDDNDAMNYERRKEKISFFNGRLYTGFSFDL
jgi:hypothetical protein